MTAEITDVMAELKATLETVLPARKFSRDLLDFGDRAEADLKAGIYTLLAGPEDTPADYMGREGNFATLHPVIVGQVVVDETHPPVPHEAEDAESLMIDEIKALTRRQDLAANISSLLVRGIRRSMQQEYPYGWVSFQMELMLS